MIPLFCSYCEMVELIKLNDHYYCEKCLRMWDSEYNLIRVKKGDDMND